MDIKVQGTHRIEFNPRGNTYCRRSNFYEIFNRAKQDIDEEKNASEENKVSWALKNLERIFHINMENNPERFYKENGQLNIMDIIEEYGDNVSFQDLKELSKTIIALKDLGKIDEEDFIKAMRWITDKIQGRAIQFENENRVAEELEKVSKIYKKDDKK